MRNTVETTIRSLLNIDRRIPEFRPNVDPKELDALLGEYKTVYAKLRSHPLAYLISEFEKEFQDLHNGIAVYRQAKETGNQQLIKESYAVALFMHSDILDLINILEHHLSN